MTTSQPPNAEDPRDLHTFEQARLKDATFYTKLFSVSFLFVTVALIATFLYTLSLLLRPGVASRNTIVVGTVLPLVYLCILLHRSRIRQLIQNRPKDSPLLGEMASTLIALTIGLCALAAMAAH